MCSPENSKFPLGAFGCCIRIRARERKSVCLLSVYNIITRRAASHASRTRGEIQLTRIVSVLLEGTFFGESSSFFLFAICITFS